MLHIQIYSDAIFNLKWKRGGDVCSLFDLLYCWKYISSGQAMKMRLLIQNNLLNILHICHKQPLF